MTMLVKFKTIADIQKFAQVAFMVEEDLMLESGPYIVNAKSFMGILSLDLSKATTLRICTEDNSRFEELSELFAEFAA